MKFYTFFAINKHNESDYKHIMGGISFIALTPKVYSRYIIVESHLLCCVRDMGKVGRMHSNLKDLGQIQTSG